MGDDGRETTGLPIVEGVSDKVGTEEHEEEGETSPWLS